MTESKKTIEGLEDRMLPENSDRANKQSKTDIRIIIGNPPYSGAQDSVNDANPNLKYSALDDSIRNSYAANSTATNKTSLYNSYIRAIRWASDRIKDTGLICYVSNGYYIDSKAADGLRRSLTNEFSAVYCFNLRGDQTNTSGEKSRQEGGKIFGSLSRSSIAITLLVKNAKRDGQCKLYYHDIGDYLNREQKLEIISKFGSYTEIPWTNIVPNEDNDWINQRDPAFEKFIPSGDRKGTEGRPPIFSVYSNGVQSNRESWVWNFGKSQVTVAINRMIEFYNSQVTGYEKAKAKGVEVDDFIDTDSKKIGWTRSLKSNLGKLTKATFKPELVVQGMYRPFVKQHLYFDRFFNEYVNKMPAAFPFPDTGNMLISVCSTGSNKEFSAFVVNVPPDVEMISKGQCFPLYTYERAEGAGQLFERAAENGYVKKDAVTDEVLKEFQAHYDRKITKLDIFYYFYGVLHSQEYRTRFAADLKKMLPRIPLVKDFWAFSNAGKKLAAIHLNYESAEPYALQESTVQLELNPKEDYRVRKMSFPKKGKELDKSRIVVNANVTLGGIPVEAYEYIVNGKSAVEVVMDNYRLDVHKDSKISNDPNDWNDDPRYIIDLLRRLVTVSVETVKIVNGLPPLSEHVEAADEHCFEVSRSVQKLSAADAKEFFEALPEWVSSQRASHAMSLSTVLKVGQDEKSFEEFAKARVSPIELDDHSVLGKLNANRSYSVVAVFPTGASRTIGEVKDGKIELFGYWSLFDPDETTAPEKITSALKLTLNFVVVEVKNGVH